jgi:NAD(P)-dependent dehydrogenase (short-subunit alcohol dehydrogenase family)
MDLELADKVTVVTGGRDAVVASIGGFATSRFTTSEEVGTLVTLLASERLSNVTGVNYVIDGGLIKTT